MLQPKISSSFHKRLAALSIHYLCPKLPQRWFSNEHTRARNTECHAKLYPNIVFKFGDMFMMITLDNEMNASRKHSYKEQKITIPGSDVMPIHPNTGWLQ
ncbi:hypothetical protein OCU04_005451 [Sclerotinia nivalis]|uniref:Uncharacterized protein n=1 Tax=Sclerotinia nivalis TaxID=352851 RepID=A0A9X0APX9_9HELO|nr:hypothetical protein OCU04_005451 [Sclerotinia nivalis]